jgi:phospholipid/cholesterol/gamma-HCH transport system permease protein
MESQSLPADEGLPRIEPQPAGLGDVEGRPFGAGVKDFFEEMGELTIFCLEAFKALPGTIRYFSEVLRLNAIITRRTSLLMFVMAGFIGVSMANFGFFFLRSIGASDFVGILPGLISSRQTTPQMFGYVFAGSACCAFAAELGAARIQEEIDAYEAQGIDPMQFLVGTRVLASLMFAPLAAALGMAGNILGCGFTVVTVLQGNSSQQYFDTAFSIFPLTNLFFCIFTVAVMSVQLSLVACFYGMRDTGGGPVAVGQAVARSLAINIVVLHVVFSVMALIFYGGSLGVPIGD